MKTLIQVPGRIALIGVLACVFAAARPGPVAASAVCPPPPTQLAALIAVDATNTGPLTDAFRPIYGHYAEGAANCWGDTPITVRAFVAAPEGLGGTRSYRIEPDWLMARSHFLSVTDAVDPQAGPQGPFFAVAIKPAMEARFARLTGRWVTVTGHFHDPAAETCVVDAVPEATGVPTAEQGIEICRTAFVLTAVNADQLPPTHTAPPMAGNVDPSGTSPAVVLVGGVAVLVAARRFGRAGPRRR